MTIDLRASFATSMFTISICLVAESAAGQTCPDLAPRDDGTDQSIGLVVSEVAPGDFVELFNFTSESIDLTGQEFHVESSAALVPLETLSGSSPMVPPLGYRVLAWPSSFVGSNAAGEIALSADSSLTATQSLVDFVCWGGGGALPSQKPRAEAAGKWIGPCAPPLAAGAITRFVETLGVGASDYDATSSPSTVCDTEILPCLDPSDTDRDGIGDACDNCPLTHNPDQEDRGGIGGAGADGTGDRCQSADFDRNGTADLLDLVLLRRALVGLEPNLDPSTPPAGACTDFDEDGVAGDCLPLDCDDDEPASFPGNDEICDGLDNDCDDVVDEGCGGLQEGEVCTNDPSGCAIGLRCCYPCGIPGCENQCMPPDPVSGECPLMP